MRRALPALLALILGAACRVGSADTGGTRDRAVAEARRGNPVTALRMLRGVVERAPADSAAYAEIADLYRRYGWAGDGYEFFRLRAERQDDRLPELRYYAAAFAAFTGRGDEADRWLAAARARRPPTEAEALATAEALIAIGRESSARALLEGATRDHPERFEPRVRLAMALANAGDTVAASAEMNTALGRFPAEPRVIGAAAALRFLVGDLDGSEQLTHRWLALAPDDAEARWNLTRIALRRGEYDQADSLLLLTARTRR